MCTGESDTDDDGFQSMLAQDVASAPEAERLEADVGWHRALPPIGGTVVGDDVSWRGSKVVRFVALQTNDSSGDLY